MRACVHDFGWWNEHLHDRRRADLVSCQPDRRTPLRISHRQKVLNRHSERQAGEDKAEVPVRSRCGRRGSLVVVDVIDTFVDADGALAPGTREAEEPRRVAPAQRQRRLRHYLFGIEDTDARSSWSVFISRRHIFRYGGQDEGEVGCMRQMISEPLLYCNIVAVI